MKSVHHMLVILTIIIGGVGISPEVSFGIAPETQAGSSSLSEFTSKQPDSYGHGSSSNNQSQSRQGYRGKLVPGRITVIFSEPLSNFELASFEEQYDMRHINPVVVRNIISFTTQRDIPNLLSELNSSDLVVSASQDEYIVQNTADPLFSDQWYLKNIGQSFVIGIARLFLPSEAINELITTFRATTGFDIHWLEAQSGNYCNGYACDGSGVVVAVIDSGVDYTHPDLQGQIDDRSVSVVYETGDPIDINGHGTFVTGLISAKKDNAVGMTGVAPGSKVLAIEASIFGSFTSGDWLIALQYAADSGAGVINLSFGGPTYSSQADYMIQAALNSPSKPIIVASAGNEGDGENLTLFPASYDGVISVASYDPDGLRTSFSQYNEDVDISAPGGLVTSLRSIYAIEPIECGGTPYGSMLMYEPENACTFDDNGNLNVNGIYKSGSGTSFSAPIVSGAAALMKEKYGNSLTSQKFQEALQYSSDHPTLPSGQRDNDYGYGRLNLERLLSYNFAPELYTQQVGFNPSSVPNDGSTQVQLVAQVENMEGSSDVSSVTADLSTLGQGSVSLSPNGNLSYSTTITIQSSTSAGNYSIPITVTDLGGKSATANASLTVTDSASGGSDWIDPGTANPVADVPAGSEVSIEITSPNKGKDDITRKERVTIKGEAGNGVAYVEVYGEAATLDVTTGDWNLKVELDEGDNDIKAIAYDVTRTNTATDDMQIELDTEAPKDVKNLEYSNGKLSWDESKSNDVEGYHVYQMNGKKKKEIDVTTKEYAEVSGAGPFRVTAEDEAGNESDIDDAPEVGGVMEGADTGFVDVPKSHWASGYVFSLKNGNVVSGESDRYDPERFVTRAEFAKMLIGVRKEATGAETTMFADVPQGYSLSKYIQAVLTQGWARGQGRYFYPGRPITRMEAAWMIVRAARLKETDPANFPDITQLNDKIVAGMLVENGIASGNNGKFLPGNFLTRAEAAKMLSAIMI
jgi:subtilisin family serine protease